jgi:tripartite-type tricarboxylate transporter receptor subunit TctC
MINSPRAGIALAGVVAAVLTVINPAVVDPAAADDYPARPVRLLVPLPAGGSNDMVGRLVATRLGERLGRQLVVDNGGGAGGIIGTEVVAKSPPDGYMLLLVSMAHAVNPWIYKLSDDPVRDFAPVALLAEGANVLVVHPSVPANSVQDLIALARKKPGELDYASAGIGTFQHLGGELFKLMTGVDMVHVPFRGGGPSMLSVAGGHAKVTFPSLAQTVPYIRSGALRALGTGGRARSPVLPDLPTIAEAGVPGYEAVNWWGIVAPAGTPRAIVDRPNGEIAAVVTSIEVQKQLASEGATPVSMTPEAFAAFIAHETESGAGWYTRAVSRRNDVARGKKCGARDVRPPSTVGIGLAFLCGAALTSRSRRRGGARAG